MDPTLVVLFAAVYVGCAIVSAIGLWSHPNPFLGDYGAEAIAAAVRDGGPMDVYWSIWATIGPLVWPLVIPAILVGWGLDAGALIGSAVVYRVRYESSRRLDNKREAGMLTVVDDAQTGGR